jgi:hypothetical protein
MQAQALRYKQREMKVALRALQTLQMQVQML